MFFDPLYIILIVATLVISSAAQSYIRLTYGTWSRVAIAPNLTGGQVAEVLRDHARSGDRPGRSMLTGAALTYLAAAITAVVTLLFYLTIARRSD